MELLSPLLLRCSTLGLREAAKLQQPPLLSSSQPIHLTNRKNPSFHYPSSNISSVRNPLTKQVTSSSPLKRNTFTSLTKRLAISQSTSRKMVNAQKKFFQNSESSDDDDDEDDPRTKSPRVAYDPYLMTEEERLETRRKIREVLDMNPVVEEVTDPEQRKIKMEKLLADYPLVVEEDDPDWPEDADGWGFKFDQFFNNIKIKNVRKEDDDGYDSEKEIVWQDDDYIKPIRDITSGEWEDTVFKDFNPCIILVHNRYKRPKENVRARDELEKAVKLFWETGLPSPRCVAVDAVVEDELVETLQVSIFPEIIFTKAGKILHRDKVVRTADEWSKMMAFFYYKAARPSCLDKAAGLNQEKIPSFR